MRKTILKNQINDLLNGNFKPTSQVYIFESGQLFENVNDVWTPTDQIPTKIDCVLYDTDRPKCKGIIMQCSTEGKNPTLKDYAINIIKLTNQ